MKRKGEEKILVWTKWRMEKKGSKFMWGYIYLLFYRDTCLFWFTTFGIIYKIFTKISSFPALLLTSARKQNEGLEGISNFFLSAIPLDFCLAYQSKWKTTNPSVPSKFIYICGSHAAVVLSRCFPPFQIRIPLFLFVMS